MVKVDVLIYEGTENNQKVKRKSGNVDKLISVKKYIKEVDRILKVYSYPHWHLRKINDKVFGKDYILSFDKKRVSVHGRYIQTYNEKIWTVSLYDTRTYDKINRNKQK